MSTLFTPKQVAQAIGVSESSLKRWCDRGLIEITKTPGGHRRISAAGVMAFLQQRNQPLIRPELLGLPSNTGKSQRILDRAADQFHEALATGDEEVARQVALDLYLAGHRLSAIFDRVFAPAYHRIGNRWQSHEVEVYQERRAVGIGIRLVGELRRLLPPLAEGAPVAIGGTWEGDPYQLPTMLAELTLRESGWQATNLGSSLPLATLEAALVQNRPRLFWLSVSSIADQKQFVGGYANLLRIGNAQKTAVAIGGRALDGSLRRRIRGAAFCDDLQQLEAFAASLLKTTDT